MPSNLNKPWNLWLLNHRHFPIAGVPFLGPKQLNFRDQTVTERLKGFLSLKPYLVG